MSHRAPGGGSLPILARALLALVLALSLGWTAGLSPSPARAAGIVVTTTDDTFDVPEKTCGNVTIDDLLVGGNNSVSLREAICAANNTPGDDAITFQAGLGNTILLAEGEL